MDYYGLSLLITSLLTGVKSQQLSPLVAEDFISEGGSVSLTYTFSKEASGSDEFYWYRQHPGKPPEFLLYHLGSGKILTEQTAGREINVKGRDINLLISSAAVTDSAVYYCAVRPRLTFGKPIRLAVFPKDDSPVSPTLFLLSRLRPAGSSQDVGSRSGPDVCLAAGFRPNGADLVLETTVGPIPVKTNPARLSATTKTYYYPGFSNGTISSCKLGRTRSSGGEEAGDRPDTIYPEKSKQNFLVLLTSAVRLIFAKAVTFNAILTIRTLVM